MATKKMKKQAIPPQPAPVVPQLPPIPQTPPPTVYVNGVPQVPKL